jgi:SAM-dependent methyltransferase
MDSVRQGSGAAEYESRIASEIDIYRDCTDVHNLPPIFHYWSNRYLRPMLEQHGFTDPAGMFLLALEKQCAEHPGPAAVQFLSLGSGNCDLEVGIAIALRAKGYEHFAIECLDLNQTMLQRGAKRAAECGVAENLEFVEGDLNHWIAHREYHAVMADQSLHHVVELESLFRQIGQALRSDGMFVISDMIGRNGHLRWPRALTIVREFWKNLPPSYRRNCLSGRYEAVFEDTDCSSESFEGIRAQDIVRLLADRFCFRFFLGFGNVIDPFVDRCFGPNFDPASDWDREFIDRVHLRDQAEMAAGHLSPTHMLAVLGTSPNAAPVFGPYTPPSVAVDNAAVDSAANDTVTAESAESGYEWGSWPHAAEAQLKRICHMMEDSENRLKALETELKGAIVRARHNDAEFQERTAWALQLDRQLRGASLTLVEKEEELTGRTAWALRLERELMERTAWARGLEGELADTKAWARGLEGELAGRTAWARTLEGELAGRTAWAMRLEAELAGRTEWALRLDRELAQHLHRPPPLRGGIAGFLQRWLMRARRLLSGSADANGNSQRVAPPTG